MSNTETKTYDWDAVITNDGEGSFEESVVLPDGNYDFEVIRTEKGWYEPKAGSSIPACNMCKIYLRVKGGDQGNALVVENLYLCDRTEWKISAFLRAIGLKKHGEDISVSKLLHCDGETGRCQIRVDTYTDRNDQKRENNKLVRFYDKAEDSGESKPAAKKWSKGAF